MAQLRQSKRLLTDHHATTAGLFQPGKLRYPLYACPKGAVSLILGGLIGRDGHVLEQA